MMMMTFMEVKGHQRSKNAETMCYGYQTYVRRNPGASLTMMMTFMKVQRSSGVEIMVNVALWLPNYTVRNESLMQVYDRVMSLHEDQSVATCGKLCTTGYHTAVNRIANASFK